MSAHEGVSCDVCSQNNFRSKRYKCLRCYDYDLCSNCYEQGEISSNHTADHPMQCILTRQDFDLYYHGERCTFEQPQSLSCPFCSEMGFSYNSNLSSNDTSSSSNDLLTHLQSKHGGDQQGEVICPICCASLNGEPNLLTPDLISHIANDHPYRGATDSYSRQSSTREFDSAFPPLRNSTASTTSVAFRRGPLRTPSRRSGGGRGGPVSSNFTAEVSGNDPITDLLTQLSNVRRLAAQNNSNNSASLPPSANALNLSQLSRQQYDRERLRSTLRSHHHSHLHGTGTTSANNNNNSAHATQESDFLDSLFSSALFIDPNMLPPSTVRAPRFQFRGVQRAENQQLDWSTIVNNSDPSEQTPQTNPVPSQPQIVTTTTADDSLNLLPSQSLLKRLCDASDSDRYSSNHHQTKSRALKCDFVQKLLISTLCSNPGTSSLIKENPLAKQHLTTTSSEKHTNNNNNNNSVQNQPLFFSYYDHSVQ